MEAQRKSGIKAGTALLVAVVCIVLCAALLGANYFWPSENLSSFAKISGVAGLYGFAGAIDMILRRSSVQDP